MLSLQFSLGTVLWDWERELSLWIGLLLRTVLSTGRFEVGMRVEYTCMIITMVISCPVSQHGGRSLKVRAGLFPDC